jgi:hypothetical protein
MIFLLNLVRLTSFFFSISAIHSYFSGIELKSSRGKKAAEKGSQRVTQPIEISKSRFAAWLAHVRQRGGSTCVFSVDDAADWRARVLRVGAVVFGHTLLLLAESCSKIWERTTMKVSRCGDYYGELFSTEQLFKLIQMVGFNSYHVMPTSSRTTWNTRRTLISRDT